MGWVNAHVQIWVTGEVVGTIVGAIAGSNALAFHASLGVRVGALGFVGALVRGRYAFAVDALVVGAEMLAVLVHDASGGIRGYANTVDAIVTGNAPIAGAGAICAHALVRTELVRGTVRGIGAAVRTGTSSRATLTTGATRAGAPTRRSGSRLAAAST